MYKFSFFIYFRDLEGRTTNIKRTRQLQQYISGERTGLEMFLDPDELQHVNDLLMFRTWTRKIEPVDAQLAAVLKIARRRERKARNEMVRGLMLKP